MGASPNSDLLRMLSKVERTTAGRAPKGTCNIQGSGQVGNGKAWFEKSPDEALGCLVLVCNNTTGLNPKGLGFKP